MITSCCFVKKLVYCCFVVVLFKLVLFAHRYIKRQLSTSSVSMEWTAGEPYASPYGTASTPNEKSPRPSLQTLGTSV